MPTVIVTQNSGLFCATRYYWQSLIAVPCECGQNPHRSTKCHSQPSWISAHFTAALR